MVIIQIDPDIEDTLNIMTNEQAGQLLRDLVMYAKDESVPDTSENARKVIFHLTLSRFAKFIHRTGPNDTLDRSKKEYKIWRNEVFRRDDFRCAICGDETNIEAHHIKPFLKYPDLRFDVNNGITLCRNCHKEMHRQKGR